MACSCIGALVVIACLLGGVYTGWLSQRAYQHAKDKAKKKNPFKPPTPPAPPKAATQDIGRLQHASSQGGGHPGQDAGHVGLKQLPGPGYLKEMRAKLDGESYEIPKGMQMWYQLHDDRELLDSGVVHTWLGALESSGRMKLDPDLHSSTHELLGFLRMRAPNLLEQLRRFHQTGKLPQLSDDEVKAMVMVLTEDNVLSFSRAPDDRHMLILANIQVQDKGHDKDTGLHAASKEGLEDVSLTPKARLERDFGVKLEDARMQDPREQLKDYLKRRQQPQGGPFSFFPKICIPTVWHVLQFEEDGYVGPGNAYWLKEQPALELLECANKHFELSGMPIHLVLSEWRNDVTQYPYLNIGTFAKWQQCAEDAEQCTEKIAVTNNVDPHEVLNVYTVGSAACEDCCKSCASGYVSHLGDVPDIETYRSQHLTMAWDRVDPDIDNSPRVGNKGCGTFTHEVAHILGGLYHTHTGNCSDGDMVTDTAPNKDGNTVPWRADLSKWCAEFQRDGHPQWADLAQFDSCKGDEYIDNVFNFMSYNPATCRIMFTPGQVQRMMESLYVYRPKLLDNSRCVNLS